MRDASQDRKFVRALGQFWQVFTDLDARSVGFDWIEFAAKLRGCIRFEVERVQMGGATGKLNENGGLSAEPSG